MTTDKSVSSGLDLSSAGTTTAGGGITAHAPARVTTPAFADPVHALLDAVDAQTPIVDMFLEDGFKVVAQRIGVTRRDLWEWVKASPAREKRYYNGREARAIDMVDEAHQRTTTLADNAPDNPHAVMARVKTIQWDAARSSKLYAERSITESHSTVDITVTMQDAEVANRLASLMGGIDTDNVIDGEIVESDQ